MTAKAAFLKYEILDSELEALLIEAELIRLHQPEYNSLLKDDKSPIYVQITEGVYPRVKMVRRRDILQKNLTGTILGPYQSGYKLKQVLKIARKLFGWCDKAQTRLNPEEIHQPAAALKTLQKHQQACFYQHLDLCPSACTGQISPQEYQKNIQQLILFLRGKKKQVLKNLKEKMTAQAADLKYEQAAQTRNKINLIKEITQQNYRLKPDLVLPALHDNAVENALDHLLKILQDLMQLPRQYQLTRIEGYDVSNIQGKNAAVSLVCFTHGLPDKKNYRLFNIKSLDTPNDYQMLKEALTRRQNHPEWGKPHLLVIDGGKGQVRAALSVWEWPNPVIGIAKNPDRLIIPTQHYLDKKTHRLKIEYEVVNLDSKHPTLQLVQRIRDESHRFAKKQHTRLRRKNLLR